jgi:uroporphyrinogen-III synthase
MAKPLYGKRIVVTRSPDLAGSIFQQLAALGAIPIRFPTIDFVSLPGPQLAAALANLASYDWLVFTSGNGVRFFFERVASSEFASLRVDEWPRVAAVGEATARLLRERGVTADFMPESFTGEQLALGLGDTVGKKVLLARAKIGRPEIVDLLRERGAVVDEIALYESVPVVPTAAALAELDKGIDVITFTSPSTVRHFLEIVKADSFAKAVRSALIACIGPTTAAEAEKQGLSVAIMPDVYTIDGLMTALVAHFEKENC